MLARPWLSTYRVHGIPEQIDADVCPSVAHLLDAAMQRYADKPAFRSFGQTLSYTDVDRLSSAFAAWLQQQMGVKKGDRIALMLPNILAFPIASLGLIRAGAVQVNVNPLYTPRELEHQLNDAGCKFIVIFSGATSTLAEIIDKTQIQTTITVNLADGSAMALPSPPVDQRLHHSHIPFAEALKQGSLLKRQPVELCGKDLLFLQYTGGTTGLSKGACLSHRNLLANIQQYKALMPNTLREGQEVLVTAIPLYHVLALMANFITYFSVGADNWLVANPRDMDGFIDTLKRARPSVFIGVNTLYAGLSMHPRISEVDFGNLRLAAGGGAAVVSAISERWKAITGTFIREGYGLSETSPILSFNPAAIDRFSGTTGVPVPSTDIKLLLADGSEAALGEPGEICAKGPQVMRGYWNKPEANAAAFTMDGYFRTGDIGCFDAQGLLKIVDRKKDMVIVSGFNVFPNEVEEVATACAAVGECACVGVPDERTGEAVKLFVVRKPGATLSAEDLIAHCRKLMTAYKVPKLVQFVDSLPKSAVGKILRKELRELK